MLQEQVDLLKLVLSSAAFAYIEQDVNEDITALTQYIDDSDANMNEVPRHFRFIGERAQLKRFRKLFETHIEMCLELIAQQKQQEPKQQDGSE